MMGHKGNSYEVTYFEVVPKRPVAQHLEECMVIRVLSDIIQVLDRVSYKPGAKALVKRTVMLPSCPYALLSVECTLQLGHVRVWVYGTQEYRFILANASEL